jgi:glyoxylate reductase
MATYRVVADGPLAPSIVEMMGNNVTLLPWELTETGSSQPVDAIYTYGHPILDGQKMDRLPGVKVISNYGVGVDHIRVADAADRGIPVGNTPNVLNGATADMALTLMLATGRRLIEGDHFARSPEFTYYDPGYMLGVEIHSQTIGIVGMGRIGQQIAKRAGGFDMRVIYHNRRRREEIESELSAQYVSFDELLDQSDYLVLSCPLTEETHHLIAEEQFAKMKSTAILINVARGPVVDTDALTTALSNQTIYAAGLDVTDPEPLPRDHPLLKLNNVTIAPHLGSATQQTRHQMAEISIANLFAGLSGEPLLHTVNP